LDRGIFIGIIAVIVLTAIPYGTVDPWSEALFECGVFFLALLWIIQGFIAGSWRIGNTVLIAPMTGLVILAIAQSIRWWKTEVAGEHVWFAISADPFETWAFAFRMAALVIATVLVIRFTSNTRRLAVLVHSIIVVAVASALFGIARQATQHGSGFFLSRLQPGQGFGQFINKNHFAFLIEMAVGLVIGMALMGRSRRERLLLYVSALLLMWSAIVLSNSRGGLLAVTVQGVFAALVFVNSRTRGNETDANQRGLSWTRSIAVSIVLIGALLVSLVIGVMWLGGDQLATGVETATVEMSGADATEMHEGARRRDIWRATWQMFKAHPIAGAGLGGFWAEVPVFHHASGVLTPQQAHNDYLELLASGGLLGVALFIWFLIALFKQIKQGIKARDEFQRSVVLGAIIGVVGVGAHSMVEFGLHITINALVLVVLLGIISLNPVAVANDRPGLRLQHKD